MKPLLKTYRETLGSQDRTFTVPKGWYIPHGVTVVVGANGTGKSRLIDIILQAVNNSDTGLVPAIVSPLTIVKSTGSDIPENWGSGTLLLLDDPYPSLIEYSKLDLNNSLSALAASGCNILLTLSDPRDIPTFANSLMQIESGKLSLPIDISNEDIDAVRRGNKYLFGYAIDFNRIPHPLQGSHTNGATMAETADRTLKISAGEKWVLEGPAKEKSALILQLASASSVPFGYVGTALDSEISPIKSVIEVVGDGLDSALFEPNERNAYALIWLKLLHIEHLAARPFSKLSRGEQRMAIIARALIGNPPLLLLDDPMAGLDYGRKRSLRALINFIVTQPMTPIALVVATTSPLDVPEAVTKTYNISTHATAALDNL